MLIWFQNSSVLNSTTKHASQKYIVIVPWWSIGFQLQSCENLLMCNVYFGSYEFYDFDDFWFLQRSWHSLKSKSRPLHITKWHIGKNIFLYIFSTRKIALWNLDVGNSFSGRVPTPGVVICLCFVGHSVMRQSGRDKRVAVVCSSEGGERRLAEIATHSIHILSTNSFVKQLNRALNINSL